MVPRAGPCPSLRAYVNISTRLIGRLKKSIRIETDKRRNAESLPDRCLRSCLLLYVRTISHNEIKSSPYADPAQPVTKRVDSRRYVQHRDCVAWDTQSRTQVCSVVEPSAIQDRKSTRLNSRSHSDLVC